jgi:hypothetical protein
VINYLYRGATPHPRGTKNSILRKLYFLAEKLCFVELMDTVIDQIREFQKDNKTYAGQSSLSQVYQHTHLSSRLGHYFVAQVAVNCAFTAKLSTRGGGWAEELVRTMEAYPDFAVDLVNFQLKYAAELHTLDPSGGTSSKWVDLLGLPGVAICDFHTHGPEGICYLQRENPKP